MPNRTKTRRNGRRTFLAASIGALIAPRPASAYVAARRRPYVQNVRRTRATIRWTSLNTGTASVAIRLPDGADRVFPCLTVEMSEEQTGLSYSYFKHTAVLTGLEPGTEYAYKVRIDGEALETESPFVFRTAGTSACSFLAIGDTGTGSAEQLALAARMEQEQPGLVIHTGDVVYPTGKYEYYEARYFDFYHATMRRVPFFPCPGNHDYYESHASPYVSVHDLPVEGVPAQDQGRYYSFDWGDVHFISLDSNTPLTQAASGRGDMLRWLEQDLAATKKFWRVAFIHHPPYAFGPNSGDSESARVRSHVVPILERHGVPLLLSGHEHSYQRTQPINRTTYVTTGGGGASLYPVHASHLLARGESIHHYLRVVVEGRRLIMRAINAQGEQFDEVTISPPPLLGASPVLNAASFGPQIGDGSIVSIFGLQLAPETLDSGGRPLPEGRRSGVGVSAGGREMSLLMVSPTQVNAVLPAGLTGAATLRITTPGGEASWPIQIDAIAPALFPLATQAAGVVNSIDAPCPAGGALTLFATGVSGVEGAVEAEIDGLPVPARIAPSALSGMNTVEFEIPAAQPAGKYSIRLRADGLASNSIPVFIRN